MLDTGSKELIDLHAKMFKKHGATTIRNFDALNDVRNLQHSANCITKHKLKHEIVVTMMDLHQVVVELMMYSFMKKY